MSVNLSGSRVFLSASFPTGSRGERYRPYDPAEVADAVTAVVRALFIAGGSLVFGGHPTITPLVLHVAAEHGVRDRVIVYQTSWFTTTYPARLSVWRACGMAELYGPKEPQISGRASS